MAPKIKDFTKPNSKTKSKVSNPESENDFLEAAEEFEQGGVSNMEFMINLSHTVFPMASSKGNSFSASSLSDMN